MVGAPAGPPLPRRLKFGCFQADLRSGELTNQGKRLQLQEQPFRLLAMLLERPGELVTREELRRKLWPRAVVDFDHGVNKAISKIRDALGDSAEKPRFVETVARRGYRFLADVAIVPEEESSSVATRESTAVNTAPMRPRRVALWIVSGAVLVALLSSAPVLFRWQHAPATIRSLAVLPLYNLSDDASQEYFADGMTDELITQLGQIRALRIVSSTSVMTYKHVHKPLADIARELNVQAVVEGSVLRVGDRVRITAQLIRVPADGHLWAHSYEGSLRDALALQSEVARAIAGQVLITLGQRGRARSVKARVLNPAAYEAYLKGRFFWNKRTRDGLAQAIEYFDRAIALDPAYAQAYAGLADAYALAGDWEYGLFAPAEAIPKAQAAAVKALALDGTLATAHTALAFTEDVYGWNWDGAEQEYRRALALGSSYATAHHWYAFHLLLMGKAPEAILEIREAERLDPLSLIISSDVADVLSIAHLYDESIAQSRKALQLDPNFPLAHYQLGQALEQKGLHDQAIAEFQRAIEIGGHSGVFDSNLAYAYAMSGRKELALRIVEELQARRSDYPAVYANIALVDVGLHDFDAAMGWLQKAYDARFNPSILLRPGFDPLRRFTLPSAAAPPGLAGLNLLVRAASAHRAGALRSREHRIGVRRHFR